MTRIAKKSGNKSTGRASHQKFVSQAPSTAAEGKGGKMAFVYEKITQVILAQLEKGVVPWRVQYKKNGHGFPQNYCSKRPYSSVNMLLLATLPYERPYYLTMKQINTLGGRVKKGESGHIVTYWQFATDEKKAELLADGKSAAPLFRFYFVWNIEQTQDINFNLPDLDALAEKNRQLQRNDLHTVVNRMSSEGVTISHICPNLPCYIPQRDQISIPTISEFRTPENYYKTLFHELIHATGHPNRLNRETIAGYIKHIDPSTQDRAFEELIAELGTSFVLGALGVELGQADTPDPANPNRPDLVENAAAYIEHYSRLLSSDRTMIVKAASKAQAAADYVLGQVRTQSIQE